MKKIPKSYEIGGFEIKVVMLDAADLARKAGDDVYGQFSPDELTIYLCKPSRKVKQQVVYQTFWHEYAHSLMWVVDQKRYLDERYVDQIGHCLAQFHQTAVI